MQVIVYTAEYQIYELITTSLVFLAGFVIPFVIVGVWLNFQDKKTK